ncbi:hypothetical protein PIB30_083479, partial [Stylosanthes scabra]|nr:hypothetical protein [Stylosanthes scabra]
VSVNNRRAIVNHKNSLLIANIAIVASGAITQASYRKVGCYTLPFSVGTPQSVVGAYLRQPFGALHRRVSLLPSRFVLRNQWLLPPLESESPSSSSSTPKLVSLFSFNPSLRFSNAGSSLPSLLHGHHRFSEFPIRCHCHLAYFAEAATVTLLILPPLHCCFVIAVEFEGYRQWFNHGESFRVDVDGENPVGEFNCNDNIDELLRDRFGDTAAVEGQNVGPNEDAKEFYKLVEEARQELYPECKGSQDYPLPSDFTC